MLYVRVPTHAFRRVLYGQQDSIQVLIRRRSPRRTSLR